MNYGDFDMERLLEVGGLVWLVIEEVMEKRETGNEILPVARQCAALFYNYVWKVQSFRV